MALASWSLSRDILSIREEMNRLLNEFFGPSNSPEGSWPQAHRRLRWISMMPATP